MNFFEHQERARKSSGRLVLLFSLAVLLIVATCYAAVQAFFIYQGRKAGVPVSWWNSNVFLSVAVPVMGIIAFASLSKIALLKQGGAFVAQSLGGKHVNPSTKDPAERRYLNVVEEMALAAGVPVPPAFVLENEEGINAFAAGNTPSDAAVAVTRGALNTLNRDELQGVVAHEFSHIVNGDMRLNIRLMGLLAGILALAVVGWYIIRFAPRGGKKGGSGVAIAGVAMVILGYGGVFVGRLIQSAVSRQREYLADASAVQFTRNPSGIAGALKKIGGFAQGSLVGNPAARETSHMFFGEAVSGFFTKVFATHPPLAERIRRVDPQFNPELDRMQKEQASSGKRPKAAAVAGFAGASSGIETTVDETVERTGVVTAATMEHSRNVSQAIAERVREWLEHPLTASAVVAALLMDKEAEGRERQLALLTELGGEAFGREIARVYSAVSAVPRALRLPLVDVAMPALRQMSQRQAQTLRQTLLRLAMADNTMTLSEFALLKVVEARLEEAFQAAKPASTHDVRKVTPEVSQLLTALAYAGDPKRAEQAFRAGLKGLATTTTPALGAERFQADVLSSAFDTLARCDLNVRKAVLRACAQTVLLDQVVSDDEAELLRAVAYTLALPLPPFLPKVSA